MVKSVEVFAHQTLNDDSDITGTPELMNAAGLINRGVKRVNKKKYNNAWSVRK